jgi:hypothetical protein
LPHCVPNLSQEISRGQSHITQQISHQAMTTALRSEDPVALRESHHAYHTT